MKNQIRANASRIKELTSKSAELSATAIACVMSRENKHLRNLVGL
jgi:hypothetical protein